MPNLSLLSAVVLALGLLLVLTRRVWTAAGATAYLLVTILLASWIKQSRQGMAMTLGDVHFFLLHPVQNFGLFIIYPWILAAAVGLVAGAVAILLAGWRFEGQMRAGVGARTFAAALSCAIAAFGFAVTGSSQAASPHGDAYMTWLSLADMQRPNGLIGRLNVFFENRDTVAVLPPMRPQTRFKETTAAAAGLAGERPDILMVFEESTFDPTVVARCRFPECDSGMLHPLVSAAGSQEGPLLTHTTGGGSWLTEFAFFSGLDWRVFGRGGRFAPISLAPRLHHSLPRTLRALGYRTIAIYPSEGEFLGAETAYRYYGFEEFHSARELQLPDEWFKVRDSLVFEKAIAAAGRPADTRPVFVLAMTIRNHGPYRNDENAIPEEFRAIGRETSVGLADYLNRMQDSSRDYLDLAERWLDSPRPRVIGWFGDHQPEIAWDYLSRTSDLNPSRLGFAAAPDQLRYLTRYQLSSNRPTAVRPGGEARAGRLLDVSYLAADLLSFAGLPLDAGSAAALDVMEHCGGRMLDCADHQLIEDYLSYRIHDLKSVE